jgi:anti-anti-sigma factor
LKIDVQMHGSVAVLVPHGPLTADQTDAFHGKLKSAMEQRQGRVVIDLRDVQYFDSRGIETLLELCGERRSVLQRPTLAQIGETCREALDLTNVLTRLDVFDTVENAIRSYKR